MSKKGLVITIITILIILVSAFLGIKYTQEDIDKISNIVENVIEDNCSSTKIPEANIEYEQEL